jgi:hypothetical protein
MSLPVAWGSVSQFDCQELLGTTAQPTNADDLCWLLQTFLESHHRCEFPREFLDRITTGGKSEGIAKRTKDHKCLRQIAIEEIHIEDIGVVGDLVLKHKANEFVSILVYSGEKWLMYWPTRPVKRIR